MNTQQTQLNTETLTRNDMSSQPEKIFTSKFSFLMSCALVCDLQRSESWRLCRSCQVITFCGDITDSVYRRNNYFCYAML